MGHSSGLWSASRVWAGSSLSLKLAGNGIVKSWHRDLNASPNANVYLIFKECWKGSDCNFYFVAWNVLNIELLNDLAAVTQEVWGRIFNCVESKTLEFLLSNILSVWQPSFFLLLLHTYFSTNCFHGLRYTRNPGDYTWVTCCICCVQLWQYLCAI